MASQEIRYSPGAKPGFFYGYIVVAATFLIMMVVWGMYNAVGVFFKPLLTEFGWSRAMTSGAVSTSMIIRGSLGIVMGRLNDRFGPRMVLSLCGFLFGLGLLLMSRISAVWQLYLLYGVIVGTGLSGAWVPLLSTVARWFSDRRSFMTGIVLTGNVVGGLIIPPVATQLILAYDWRTSYLILGSISLIIVVLLAQFLKRDPAQIGQVPYGMNKAEKQGLKAETEAFSFREAVYTRQFWLVFGISVCIGFSVFATLVHIVPHATDLGISAVSAANILVSLSGASIVGRVVLGSAGDKIGNRQVLIIGFVLISVALFWLVVATEVGEIYLIAAVLGFGMGGSALAPSPLVAGFFGLRSHGLIYGFISLGYSIGASIGPFLAGYIFDVTSIYQLAFLISAALSILGLMLAAVLRPIKRIEVKT